MKYTTEIIIEKPIEEVIRKMDSVDNLKHWQEGLVSTEHVSGVPGEMGSTMRMSYDFGKRKMDLVETITKQDFPNEFHATYTTKGMRNIQENYFESTSKGFTKWTTVNEFQPTTFAMNAMLFLMPSAFKNKQKST